jgi:alkyl hydroperoxide reductase subunit AhpC
MLLTHHVTFRQITVNDLPVGRSVEETIRLIQAFQFTVWTGCSRHMEIMQLIFKYIQDTYGEVCPANWTEGSKTIKADPVAKLEYFTAVTDGQSNNHVNGEANGSVKKRARVD